MTAVTASPFKPLFNSTKRADGRVFITYKKKNLWFGPFMAFVVALFGAGLISGIITLLTLGSIGDVGYGVVALAAFAGVYYWLAKNWFWLEQSIEIKPGESITANKVTLPMKDLDKMWVQTSLDGRHFAVVVSGHGQDFPLTGSVNSQSLAEAIQKEITKSLFKQN